MNFIGELRDITKDWASNELRISFSIRDNTSLVGIDELRGEILDIKASKFRKKRSKDANALMWHCIGLIANRLNADKWEIYLRMLKRYGQFTYIVVKPKVVKAVKEQWRECEEIGEIDVNGEKAIQLLCYFGSHTYNTQEFSRLLEGIMEEMKELDIQPPTSEEMRRSLELWENQHQS